MSTCNSGLVSHKLKPGLYILSTDDILVGVEFYQVISEAAVTGKGHESTCQRGSGERKTDVQM